jgi:hypothetical protein
MAEGKQILRVNQKFECNQPIGQLNIMIHNSQNPFETVSFYCNQPAGHRDACRFEGKEVTVFRKRSQSI